MNVIKSYGATIVLFDFLTQLEVMHLQQLSREMYSSGISRCQDKVDLKQRNILIVSPSQRFSETLFLVKTDGTDKITQHVDERFNF